MCVHVCAHVDVCICVHVCPFVCMCMSVQVYACVHVCACVCVCVFVAQCMLQLQEFKFSICTLINMKARVVVKVLLGLLLKL